MKVDYDLYYKDSGSVNKGHYVESNESVSISSSHDYTQPRSQGLSSSPPSERGEGSLLSRLGGKMRDPGNEVGLHDMMMMMMR